MAVADTNYRVVYVDIGSYGKDCGSTVFKRSTLWTSIQTNMLELPSERPLYYVDDMFPSMLCFDVPTLQYSA
jgi:hypothetical protein